MPKTSVAIYFSALIVLTVKMVNTNLVNRELRGTLITIAVRIDDLHRSTFFPNRRRKDDLFLDLFISSEKGSPSDCVCAVDTSQCDISNFL